MDDLSAGWTGADVPGDDDVDGSGDHDETGIGAAGRARGNVGDGWGLVEQSFYWHCCRDLIKRTCHSNSFIIFL